MRAIHFLSDLHLDPQRPAIGQRFISYLQGPARNAKAIYILGDLFEVWAGDDVSAPLYSAEIQALKAVSEVGIPVYFVPGNRDFLCSHTFAEAAGLEIIKEPSTVLGLGHAMVMHGDALCTDDRGYQIFRRTVRWRWLQWLYQLLPVEAKQKIALKIRGTSKQMTRLKPEDILDVNADAVAVFFKSHKDCRILIHGHTHRPADHQVTPSKTRIVLADWTETKGEVLSMDQDGWTRHPLN